MTPRELSEVNERGSFRRELQKFPMLIRKPDDPSSSAIRTAMRSASPGDDQSENSPGD
jgi:hypothetical protein